MLQDYKLGLRMLLKYPGLTLAGGLALAIAIGIGAGWYDLMGKILAPTIPLPEGDRLVLIETQNTLTNEPEPRVVRDFLEWRRELRTIEDLGAYRTDTRNLVVGNAAPEPIQMAELTAAAFRTARVLSPARSCPARLRRDAGSTWRGRARIRRVAALPRRPAGRRRIDRETGEHTVTVIGVMPEGFGYPFNHDAWTPLPLRASYGALEGGAIGVIGRLAPGVTRSRRTPSCACSANGLPRRFRRRTRISGRA